jgi:hypothetical protein
VKEKQFQQQLRQNREAPPTEAQIFRYFVQQNLIFPEKIKKKPNHHWRKPKLLIDTFDVVESLGFQKKERNLHKMLSEMFHLAFLNLNLQTLRKAFCKVARKVRKTLKTESTDLMEKQVLSSSTVLAVGRSVPRRRLGCGSEKDGEEENWQTVNVKY